VPYHTTSSLILLIVAVAIIVVVIVSVIVRRRRRIKFLRETQLLLPEERPPKWRETHPGEVRPKAEKKK